MEYDKNVCAKIHKDLDKALDLRSSAQQNDKIGSTEPEAILYIGNNEIYNGMKDCDEVLLQLNVYEESGEEVDRAESLWDGFCHKYQEGDIEREIDGYSVTPTQELLKEREVKLIGVTEHSIIFALELYDENIWLVSFGASTDYTVVLEEVQQLRQAS